MRDKIRISKLQVSLHLGVPAEERLYPQMIEVSLNLYLSSSLFGLEDLIEKTVNYYEVSQDVIALASAYPRKLIETFNEEVLRMLLDKYPLDRVEITTDKFILPNTECVSIEMALNRFNS